MIYKPLNDFMVEEGLKSSSWDVKFKTWLKRNYPEIELKNDSNLWETIKLSQGNIVSIYKQIKLFLRDEINEEKNITRLKNLVCINCFGINIEETAYLVDEMSRNFDCFSTIEKSMYDGLKIILDAINADVIRSYNNAYQKSSIAIISKIRSTLTNNYKRLLANCVSIRANRSDRSSNGVSIHYLNDEKFQIIVGVVSCGKVNNANTYREKTGLEAYLSNLRDNFNNSPFVLRANLINQESIGMFENGDIIFGYEYIPIRKVLGMNTGECFKKVDKKRVLDNLHFDDPASLLKNMSGSAVEVLLDMEDEPIMPSFIVAIDDIKTIEVDAAKMLGLPIYVINSSSCFDLRRKTEDKMMEELKDIKDGVKYLKQLVKLYKYQEQTYLINTGVFEKNKDESSERLESTYSEIGNCIKNIYNKCTFDDNLSIKQRFTNMEKLMTLNKVICDISLTSNLNNKRNGINEFKCFFTEYSSHSKFMNEMIGKIEQKFNTKINTYALLCLASLKCNLQDYNLQICYEEFKKQAIDYLKHFNFRYMDLVDTGIFDDIDDFRNIQVYNKSNYSILLDNEELKCLIDSGTIYYIVATTSGNRTLFNKIKKSYICKSFNNMELEFQVLENGNYRIVGDNKKYNIGHNDFEKIVNVEYVINE